MSAEPRGTRLVCRGAAWKARWKAWPKMQSFCPLGQAQAVLSSAANQNQRTSMALKIAINGFGRIGRLVFRALVEQGLQDELEVVAVGDIVPADNLAYLLKYDSTQGRFNGTVSSKKSAADKPEDDILIVNGKDIHVVSAKDPSGLPWKQLGVDIVIESTGLFTDG